MKGGCRLGCSWALVGRAVGARLRLLLTLASVLERSPGEVSRGRPHLPPLLAVAEPAKQPDSVLGKAAAMAADYAASAGDVAKGTAAYAADTAKSAGAGLVGGWLRRAAACLRLSTAGWQPLQLCPATGHTAGIRPAQRIGNPTFAAFSCRAECYPAWACTAAASSARFYPPRPGRTCAVPALRRAQAPRRRWWAVCSLTMRAGPRGRQRS